jgi:hypothetical protein
MSDIFTIRTYKYDGAGIMVNVEDKHDRFYADADRWIRVTDIQKLNEEVEKDERQESEL